MHSSMKQMASDRNVLRQMADEGERSWQRMLSRGARNQAVAERSDPPAHFDFPYLVGRPTPYQCCDGDDGREHLSGGVLQVNQVVWLKHSLRDGNTQRRVTAFTPSAGLIRLDTRSLSVALQK